MRAVAIAEAKNRFSELVAAAEAGEDIIITRHGKPTLKLVRVADSKREQRRSALDRMLAAGEAHRAKYGPTTADQIIAWKNAGRR